MPLVFVHGVNTRDGEPYRAGRQAKRDFFDRHLKGASINGDTLDPVCVDDGVSFPYWGDLGASFRWDMASLPPPQGEALGAAGVEVQALHAALATWSDLAPATMDDQDGLLRLAQATSFRDAIVVLNEALIQTATSADAGGFVAAASAYAEAQAKPEWLRGVKSDAQFIDYLITEVTPSPEQRGETLGAWSSIGNAVHKASNGLKKAAREVAKGSANQVANLASLYAVARWRHGINAVVGRFTGDVFRYLTGRGERGMLGAIPTIIATALERATVSNEPLVVVGHSLGGVMTFELLSYFRPDIKVDLFISVGSQVSHFEEMTLFRSSDPSIPAKERLRAPKPPNIERWINVYDPLDILSYACEDVFSEVKDLRHESKTHTLHAHSAYFERDAFYARLRKRIDE